jgi:hypothetical protein
MGHTARIRLQNWWRGVRNVRWSVREAKDRRERFEWVLEVRGGGLVINIYSIVALVIFELQYSRMDYQRLYE